VICFHCRV